MSAPKEALLKPINNLQYCKWTYTISPSSCNVGDEWSFCEASAVAAPWGSRTYEWLIKRSLGATALYQEQRGETHKLNQPLLRPLRRCRYYKCIIYSALYLIYTKLIYIVPAGERKVSSGFIEPALKWINNVWIFILGSLFLSKPFLHLSSFLVSHSAPPFMFALEFPTFFFFFCTFCAFLVFKHYVSTVFDRDNYRSYIKV